MMATVIAFLAHLALWVPNAHHVRPSEIKCVAEAVYFEARGEPIMGRIAVANVVKNRMKRRHLSACAVVHQEAQFQGVKPWKTVDDPDAWSDAVEISALVYTGLINDYTHGATYFVEKSGLRECDWCRHKRKQAIGNHVFMRG